MTSLNWMNACVVSLFVLSGCLSAKTRSSQDPNVVSDFLTAVKANDIKKAEELLTEYGLDVNEMYYPSSSEFEPERSVFNEACASGYLDMVQMLLEKGADVNRQGRTGYTPLMDACFLSGNLDMVKLLVSEGADVNALSTQGDSALCLVADKGDMQIARFLLENGADPNIIPVGDNDSPLNWAAYRGNLSMVILLVKHGADVNLMDSRGWRPLGLAASRGYIEVVRFLLTKGAERDLPMGSGETALEKAKRSGHSDIVALLRKGSK